MRVTLLESTTSLIKFMASLLVFGKNKILYLIIGEL
jgi:hypothetical protein